MANPKEEKTEIKKTVRQELPFSFSLLKKIKKSVLGNDFELSVVFIGSTLSAKLNKKHRKKRGPTNILTFPIDSSQGEIFIDFNKSKKEAEEFDLSFHDFLIFLFIHGLLHLKGMEHGSKMEREEERLLEEFTS